MNKRKKYSKREMWEAETLAKALVYRCLRFGYLEELHGGKVPLSKTGDFSDVKVITPDMDIPWTEVSRFNNDEMKKLIKEIVDNVFTYLLCFGQEGRLPTIKEAQPPPSWDKAEIDPFIEKLWREPLTDEELEKLKFKKND
jgi:hypothetical protein